MGLEAGPKVVRAPPCSSLACRPGPTLHEQVQAPFLGPHSQGSDSLGSSFPGANPGSFDPRSPYLGWREEGEVAVVGVQAAFPNCHWVQSHTLFSIWSQLGKEPSPCAAAGEMPTSLSPGSPGRGRPLLSLGFENLGFRQLELGVRTEICSSSVTLGSPATSEWQMTPPASSPYFLILTLHL